jgi:membrane fusion protein, multidrug efflux system
MMTKPADRTTPTEPAPQSETNGSSPIQRPSGRPVSGSGERPGVSAASRAREVAVWIVIAAGSVAGWYYRGLWLPLIPFGRATAAAGTKSGQRVVPVRTAVVQQRDVNVYINGLGTVTAFKTVTLRSRVDGEIVKIGFSEGQSVGEGELLAEIDPRTYQSQLKQAEGQLARDEATLKLAKLTLARGADLLKTKSIAQQQLDEQSAMVEQLEGTIQTDEALVANARLQLSYCRIVAPISGRIGLRLVDQGNIVHANDLAGMAVITQLRPIALVFPIPQDDIPRVQKQSRETETLVVDAYDRDFKIKLATGKLLAIDNQVDATTGTLRLKAIFENEDGTLFPNQFVNARLLVDTKRDAVVAPSAAVQRGPSSTFVYVVNSEEKAELRNVVIGETEGAETIITSGLVAGEVVVTDGVEKLQHDTKVSTGEKKIESESTQSKAGHASARAKADKGPR